MDRTQADPASDKPVSRKRKRSRRDDGKRFECPEVGCNKSYSRAEHLYRHQLNHAPKEIFQCPYENCNKQFVRQDLRARHVERHKQRDPNAQGKDANVESEDSSPSGQSGGEHTPQTWRDASMADSNNGGRHRTSFPGDSLRTGATSGPPGGMLLPNEPFSESFRSSGTSNINRLSRPTLSPAYNNAHADMGHTNGDSLNMSTRSPSLTEVSHAFGHMQNQPPYYDQGHRMMPPSWPPSSNQAGYQNNTDFSRQSAGDGRSSLPFESNAANGNRYMAPPSTVENQSFTAFSAFDAPDYNFLFDFDNPDLVDHNTLGMFGEHFGYLNDLDPSTYQTPPTPSQPSPMALSSIIDPSLPELSLSTDKRAKLIEIMKQKFNDDDQPPEHRHDKSFLEGDQTDDTHPLSLSMMQTYIGSYWVHFHPQVPIIHRPTFSPDHCPDLLLLSMMIIGASALEPLHGREVTDRCANLSKFLAWHLRWALFRHECARPPAKLWMFQALLLLEFYEKMYATRELHERAHVHHDTTVTLMRRGSFLAGTSPAMLDRSVTGTSSRAGSAHNQWWDHWIAKECTTRAIFAAFVMDTLHAISFGHSAIMAVHDMKIPLPCDEGLWSATNADQVQRIEASLHANGFKPPTFLESLRKTLNRKRVKTNSFGRTIIMAGLLSVAWHLNQRDLQLSSVGVQKFPTGREKWRLLMSRAFTCWKEDFDVSIQQSPSVMSGSHTYRFPTGIDDENLFESRVVMFHLAHMAMHTDVVDVQTYAGAKQLLGRDVTNADREGAKYRIERVWAQSERAREAAFHALKFMHQVLVPEEDGNHENSSSRHDPYSARDDFLLHRPWILYFAALIIWCYGYANDGPHGIDGLSKSNEASRQDMIKFLRRVGGVSTPEELGHVKRRSSCVGMMMHLRELFRDTRWELLHEAADLLGSCIEKTIVPPRSSG